MASMSHDAGGFLVGPRLTDDLDKISRELELLREIRGDTKETVEHLGRLVDTLSGLERVTPVEPNRQQTPPRVAGAPDPAATTVTVVVDPQQGGAAARASNDDAQPRAKRPARAPLHSAAPETADPRQARIEREKRQQTASKPQEARKRGADGRFGSGEGGDGEKGESRTASAMGAASESLKSVADGLTSGADNVDPAVTAVKELGGIVAPVMGAIKPLGRMFGMGRSPEDKRQRQTVIWYRRIWGELREGNKKSGGKGMGLLLTGLMSMMGMLLGPLRAFARMTGLLRAMAAVGGLAKGLGSVMRGRRGSAGARGRAGGRAEGRQGTTAGRRDPGTRGRVDPSSSARPGRESESRAGNKREGRSGGPGREKTAAAGKAAAGAGKDLGGAAKLGKSALRKIPFLGAILGAFMFGSAAMAKDDPNATDEERKANKAENWGTMGGVIGGVAGGLLGMIGGPAGAILGGIIGDQLGTAIGSWLSSVDMAGMMASISGAWTAVADSASKMASNAFGAVKDGWNSLVSMGTSVISGMADFVRDAWKKVSETWGKVTDTYKDVRDTVKDKVQDGKDYVGEKAASVKDAGQNLLNTVTGGRYTGGSNARKDELIKAMDAGGITDPKSKAALMANVDHETGGFKAKEENLNYSAKRLQQVFPKYYKDAESARADANNPEAIANRVYGGRMGNTDPGDGFKYRGRGDIQLTGKDQYAAMSKKLGVDLVSNPELANDPKYSAQIAVEHWKSSGANAKAAAGDIRGARVRTNGGTNGLADVEAKYEQYLPQAKAGELTPTRQANEVRVAAPAGAMDAISSTVATVKGKPGGGAGPLVTPLHKDAGAPGAAKPLGMLAMPKAAAAVQISQSGSQAEPVAAEPASAGVPVTPLMPSAAVPGAAPALGMLPIPPANVAPVSPLANMGSVQSMAPAIMGTATPAAPAPLQVPTYSAPAPDASQQRIAPAPQVTKPLAQGSKGPAAPAAPVSMPLTQNLADRAIAHAATGGIGMGGSARL